MNQLRHAYLDLAPDLDRYFVTSSHDDEPSVLQTYSFRDRVGVIHLLSGSPMIRRTYRPRFPSPSDHQ